MSLAINPDKVTAVLLADGWHRVDNFYIDSYEFVYPCDNGTGMDFDVPHGGGQYGICASGFTAEVMDDAGTVRLSAPLTSVLAVKHDIPR